MEEFQWKKPTADHKNTKACLTFTKQKKQTNDTNILKKNILKSHKTLVKYIVHFFEGLCLITSDIKLM